MENIEGKAYFMAPDEIRAQRSQNGLHGEADFSEDKTDFTSIFLLILLTEFCFGQSIKMASVRGRQRERGVLHGA